MKMAEIQATCFIAALLSAGLACAQPAASFPAVDVHASAPNETRELIGIFPGSDRYEMRSITMVELISDAWGVNADRIVGGPAWLATNHYDFVAKVPPGYDGSKLKPLLQAALIERFGLAVHNDTRPASAFAMTLSKGAVKMKKSDNAGEGGCSSAAPEGFVSASGLTIYNCRHMTMPEFADDIQSFARGYFVGAPLVDHTNLEGAWDFTIQFSPRNQLTTPDAITLFDAAEKQLGLKIEAAKLPLPVVVVDKINEKPTETSPEAAKMLAGPTEFDLVVIKPSGPDSKPQSNSPFLPGGRFELHRATIQELIEIAWDIQGDNRIVNTPAFLDKNAFDIVAKAPANGATSEMSLASMEVMIQSMLKDRFKLAAHADERPGDVFALTAAKPKLKAADPLNRPDCKAAAATSTPIRQSPDHLSERDDGAVRREAGRACRWILPGEASLRRHGPRRIVRFHGELQRNRNLAALDVREGRRGRHRGPERRDLTSGRTPAADRHQNGKPEATLFL